MSNQVHKIFGNKVRLRVCGICINNDGILLVNHRGLTQGDFWAPPGGGINFGETALNALSENLPKKLDSMFPLVTFCSLANLLINRYTRLNSSFQ
jgi:8-oxo-dGTP pyrophosphatase MutT (NUDIX family)